MKKSGRRSEEEGGGMKGIITARKNEVIDGHCSH